MRPSQLLKGGVILTVSTGVMATYTPASTIKTDVLAAAALVKLAEYSLTNPNPSSCNLLNAAKWREWYVSSPRVSSSSGPFSHPKSSTRPPGGTVARLKPTATQGLSLGCTARLLHQCHQVPHGQTVAA